MRRSIVSLTLAVGVMFFLSSFAAQSWADKGVVKMVGEITAIDLTHRTVVVEVPVGKAVFGEQLFTVGGPLSHDAELKRGGRSAKLEDFHIGDRVTVLWKTIETGHLILSLKAT
ncbi:MAG: hypothetical protein JRI71_11520 [Deltaproteobacteria bacterium]|nr:hypothetical protein [Deltaproteobacteria bacterium]MBW2078154.1 hypothetical protein [Deltaproteobacteria bacterium]MBW2312189.1 hypothetical protein [Deltaproteobacteria bacterium]